MFYISSLSALWYRWIYQIEKQSVVGRLLFDRLWTVKNGRHEMMMSNSCHNSTIKPPIQNLPISFQDNIALSLHCRFQCLIFSRHGEYELWRKLSAETHTNTTTTVCLGAPPIEAKSPPVHYIWHTRSVFFFFFFFFKGHSQASNNK